MKLKVVVVDLEISPLAKKWTLRVALPMASLLGGGAIAYAGGIVTWSNGQTLDATDLNGNFSNLQGQITTAQGEISALQKFVTYSAYVTDPSGVAAVAGQTGGNWLTATRVSAGSINLGFANVFAAGSDPNCVVTSDTEGLVASVPTIATAGATIALSSGDTPTDGSFQVLCFGMAGP